ncbi:hypothetical protein [Histidinibacterium aquaticum]|uniref:Uncharacterized protein n=1 Tax=Histidinibacterium aquaticum TaxID=2613962 RepID=A0A5J5GPK2_9RHOB|nr:hypothetical protein [Histidinibacterium aquaticum]KAA9009985.1 hypothetical protein F3S47_01605 [Histidinibacterium aquaticum]
MPKAGRSLALLLLLTPALALAAGGGGGSSGGSNGAGPARITVPGPVQPLPSEILDAMRARLVLMTAEPGTVEPVSPEETEAAHGDQ